VAVNINVSMSSSPSKGNALNIPPIGILLKTTLVVEKTATPPFSIQLKLKVSVEPNINTFGATIIFT
jgi:hypothetical protein